MRPRRSLLLPALPLLLLGGAAAGCGGETPPPEPRATSPGPEPVSSPVDEAGLHGPDPRPAAESVLLITIDTLRADAVGFAGNERVRTPVLDRLAERGRVFPRAHAHNVVTLPSHANILTGRYPFDHGVRDNAGFVLPEDIPTLATLLAEAGFATGAVVGAFPLDARFGLDRGFGLYDDRYPEGTRTAGFQLTERRGDEVVRRGLEWWREREGRPRFLWLHLFDPHAPYEPPEPFASGYAADPYLGEVAAVDSFLEPLLEPLLDDPEDRTLVVFTSDHGEALGEHGEQTHGLFAYEETLEVPLVIRSPGLSPGRGAEGARHVDVLPTVLDAVGIEPPPGLPGRSLLRPGTDPEESTCYFEALSATFNRGWAPLRGVLQGDDKLISLPIPELYDLAADPGERTNLLASDGAAGADARRSARALADRLPRESAWPPERSQVGATEAAALRNLGYLTGSAAAKRTYTAEDDPKRLVAVDQMIHRFIDLYQRGRLEEATVLAREVVDESPDMGVAYDHLAQVLLERGRGREAMEVLGRAVDRGVATGAVVRQLALLHAQQGHPERAVDLLQPRAAAGDPDDLNALGVALAEGGRPEEARRILQRVFDRDPHNPEAHQNLALASLQMGDWETARAEARTALAANERLPHAWNYLGVALYNLGRPREAVEAWERAVSLAPDDFDLLFNLGLVAAEIGNEARARSALERFVAAAPPERYEKDVARARDLLVRLRNRR